MRGGSMRCRTLNRCSRVLGQEIRDGYSRVRGRKRRDGLGGPETEERAEAPAIRRIGGENGLAVRLEHAVYQVHEPVFGQLSAGVDAASVLAVEGKAGLGYFDEEDGPGGMAGQVVARSSGTDGQVGRASCRERV